MISDEKFKNVVDFKNETYSLFLKNKIEAVDYGYKMFFFLKQNKYKPVTKPHDFNSILFNYIYWTSKIKRNITVERELFKMGVGCQTKLMEINFRFIQRRDQMVRRILYECASEISIESIKLIINNIVEIKLKELDFPIYTQSDVLERLKIEVPKYYTKSNYGPYINYIVWGFE